MQVQADRHVFSLKFLALLHCNRTDIQNTLGEWSLYEERRACSRIERFFQTLLHRREQHIATIKAAALEESSRFKFVYNEHNHGYYAGAHVIDSDGKDHILRKHGQMTPRLESSGGLGVADEMWTLLVYKGVDGTYDYCNKACVQASIFIADFVSRNLDGRAVVGAAKHGIGV